jgi:hypothetical protein
MGEYGIAWEFMGLQGESRRVAPQNFRIFRATTAHFQNQCSYFVPKFR